MADVEPKLIPEARRDLLHHAEGLVALMLHPVPNSPGWRASLEEHIRGIAKYVDAKVVDEE